MFKMLKPIRSLKLLRLFDACSISRVLVKGISGSNLLALNFSSGKLTSVSLFILVKAGKTNPHVNFCCQVVIYIPHQTKNANESNMATIVAKLNIRQNHLSWGKYLQGKSFLKKSSHSSNKEA